MFSLSKKPLVLGFTETWFTSSETGELHGSKKAVRLYELEGYQSCFCSRVTRSAGVAVYIADGFGFEVLRKSDGEVSFVQVRINGRRGHYGDLYVTIMYMPRFGSYHEYFKLLEDLFLTTPFNCRHVIMGDFNIDVSRNTVVVREYRDLIESYGYELVNRSVARSASSSVIDHVMTNRAGNTVYTVQNDISDHNGLFTVLHGTDSEPSEEEQMSLERYNFHRVRKDLAERLSHISWSALPEPNMALDVLLKCVKSAMAVGTYTLRPLRQKEESRPWIDSEVIQLSKVKKKLLQKAKARPWDLSLRHRITNVSRDMKLLKTRKRNEYLMSTFGGTNRSFRSCWQGIDLVLGRRRGRTKIDKILTEDGLHVVSQPDEIAQVLGNHFVSTPSPHSASNIDNRFLPEWQANSFFLSTCTEQEVFRLLQDLQTGKSTGIDEIPNLVLKRCADLLASPLSHCVNTSILAGVYPASLKTARVGPLFKGGCKEDPANYRPISVLNGINKIYKTVISDRLLCFLNRQSFFNASQYGFRQNSGTETAVLEALDYVYNQLDRKDVGVVTGLMVDLKRAFDTVQHVRLATKLERIGIRGRPLELMISYLDTRKQIVSLGRVLGSPHVVQAGVPQGSVSGPLFFLIFLNDVFTIGLKGRPIFYADDAAIFYPGCNDTHTCQLINDDLALLKRYFDENGLTLNVRKTKYIHFHSPQKRLNRDVVVNVNGEIVEEVSVFIFRTLSR